MENFAVDCLRQYCSLLTDYLVLSLRNADPDAFQAKSDKINQLIQSFHKEYPDPAEIERMDPLDRSTSPIILCHVAFIENWPWMQNLTNQRKVSRLDRDFQNISASLMGFQMDNFWDNYMNESLPERGKAIHITACFIYFKKPPVAMIKTDPGHLLPGIIYDSRMPNGLQDVFAAYKEMITSIFQMRTIQEALTRSGLTVGHELSTILDRTFYASIENFHGLTCLGDYIAINKLYRGNLAATLVVFLHEYAHLVKRIGQRPNYFRNISPVVMKVIDGKRVEVSEGGDKFEKHLFGKKVKLLYPEAGLFLEDPANWDVDRTSFIQAFKAAQLQGEKNGSDPLDLSRFGGDKLIGVCAFGLNSGF